MIKKFEEFVKLNESNFNNDWIKILSKFLQLKSHKEGDIKFGKKEHIWRNAVVPTKDKTNTQTLNCFLDVSESSSQSTTFNFLGALVGLCVKNEYSKINVYGFGEKMSEPFVIETNNLKGENIVEIKKCIDFIKSQNVGDKNEDFGMIAEEINSIKRKVKDSVFIIFGDGEWYMHNLILDLERREYIKDIFIMIYNNYDDGYDCEKLNGKIKDFGFENVIVTQKERI